MTLVPVDRVIHGTRGLWIGPLMLPVRPRLLLEALSLALIIAWGMANLTSALGADARVYYEADVTWYRSSELGVNSFMYPPPFVFWTAPLRLLPFEAFHALIIAAELGALIYLVGPLAAGLAVLVQFPLLESEIAAANLNLVSGAAVVLSLSRPGLWATLALTKVTPAIGGLWHLFRGEWRAVAWAAGVTLALIAPTLMWSDAWRDWFAVMLTNSDGGQHPTWIPWLARLPVAVGIVWYAARTDRAWLVPIAVVVGLPVTWEGSLIALGAYRLMLLSRCSPSVAVDPSE